MQGSLEVANMELEGFTSNSLTMERINTGRTLLRMTELDLASDDIIILVDIILAFKMIARRPVKNEGRGN